MQKFLSRFEEYCKTPGIESGKAGSYAKAIMYLCDFLKVSIINEQSLELIKSIEKEVKDRYIQYYRLAPFHLTEAELSDLNEFRDYHESSREEPDEEGYRFCRRAIGFRMPITFHYIPSMYSHKVIVECPYCHTQRELGSGTDVLEERENCVNEL